MKSLMFLILFITNLLAYGKQVVFGVMNNAPPFSTAGGVGSDFIGFNVDLTNGICEHLQVECKIVGLPLEQLMAQLNSGEIDIVSAPIPIELNMDPKFIFSLPYLPSEGQVLALRTNSTLNSIDDLKGKRVGVLKLTFYKAIINSKYAQMFELKEYSKASDMGMALMNNDIDAVIINQGSAKYVISNMLKDIKPVGEKFPVGNGMGMLALRSNAALVKDVNQALLTMENDGSYIKIYNTYFSQ